MHTATLPSSRSAGATSVPRALDVRARRDIQGRRLQIVVLRRFVRVLSLVALDVGSVAAGVALTASLTGEEGMLVRLPLLVVLAVAGQMITRTYGGARSRRYVEGVVGGLIVSTALAAWLDSMYIPTTIEIRIYVAFAVLTAIVTSIARQVADVFVGRIYRSGVAQERMLVVGSWEDEWLVREHHRIAGMQGLNVVGHLAARGDGHPSALGAVDGLAPVLQRHDIDRVVISATLPPANMREVVHECFLRGVGVSVVPATLHELGYRVTSRDVLGWSMLELEVPRLHMLQLVLKRAVDLLVTIAGLLLLAPLLLGLAIAVKLDSDGPIFFRQRRLGVDGRPFTIFKFRSMRADAEAVLRADPALYRKYVKSGFKLPPDEDPRISKLGAFLRASSLDELPQLFNILVGDMSLVGPRPIVPDEIKEYGPHAPTFLGVRPGLTGYWQVSGRSGVGYPERAELDINYIMGWSFWLDLKILAQTLPAVLLRTGAH
jgi:exopolysaccharide production protein ExoY